MKPTHFSKIFCVLFIVVLFMCSCNSNSSSNGYAVADTTEHLWRGWNQYQIPESDSMARYGHQLISKTSYYLGPNGTVAQIAMA